MQTTYRQSPPPQRLADPNATAWGATEDLHVAIPLDPIQRVHGAGLHTYIHTLLNRQCPPVVCVGSYGPVSPVSCGILIRFLVD